MEERELTIDEVAGLVSMTVRNIRAHQSRGLLPPPRIVGRTGYYGPAHVRRLQQIQAMQDQGLNLAAIAKVVTDGRLTDLAVAPFAGEDVAPQVRDPLELAERLHIGPGSDAVDRAVSLGLVAFDDDELQVLVPRLMAVAEQLADQGVPPEAMLDAVGVVDEAGRRVADAFLDLADQHLITRVAVDTGGDPEQIRAAVERLRVQASEVLTVLFDRAMAAAIRTYFDGAPAGPDGAAPSD